MNSVSYLFIVNYSYKNHILAKMVVVRCLILCSKFTKNCLAARNP